MITRVRWSILRVSDLIADANVTIINRQEGSEGIIFL